MRDTIELAREAGLAPICEGCDVPDVSYAYESWDVELKAFAALVRADEREQSLQREKFIAERWAIECASQVEIEREACAKVCDVLAVHPEYASDITKLAAAAIRNRGETK